MLYNKSINHLKKVYSQMSKKWIKWMDSLWSRLDPLFLKLWVHWTPAHSQLDGTLRFACQSVFNVYSMVASLHPPEKLCSYHMSTMFRKVVAYFLKYYYDNANTFFISELEIQWNDISMEFELQWTKVFIRWVSGSFDDKYCHLVSKFPH